MKQYTLFEEFAETPSVPAWERDDAASREVARVVLASGFDTELDYLVPERLAGMVAAGMRVEVPLGRGNVQRIGYCVEVSRGVSLTRRLKEITQQIDDAPLLTPDILRLARWIAATYLAPLGQVLETVLPSGVRHQAGTRLATLLTTVPPESFTPTQQAAFASLTRKQRHVWDTLCGSPESLTLVELQRHARCSAAPIHTLKKLGVIAARTARRATNREDNTIVPTQAVPLLTLEPQQIAALQTIKRAIDAGQHETMLLHGVTGSGKTEVYIRAISEVVRRGKQAIVLVPEISLTPQTVSRFKSRFRHVAVLHSHLTDSERHQQWAAIRSGDVEVVVGARSAVFAPVPDLGLIVIDEEHEHSFKQETTPRYHARDVAAARTRDACVPLILGSATPSLESHFAAEEGRITRITMPHRIAQRRLPEVDLVDLRHEVRSRHSYGSGAIHERLHRAIGESLQQGGQVILLLNRRGYSTHLQCHVCGTVVKCPRCDISLTHHKTENLVLCHYCDYQTEPPRACEKCLAPAVRYGGLGTQKLQQEVETRFPKARVLRMDADTMKGHGAHERALAAFRDGEYQILLGTQMIAKGLDFPHVTLVGVVNADTALHLPDFRAAERTFHLITQVAGRTGRSDRGGHVIVQTGSPESLAILAASRHDYARFAEEELRMRRILKYPPVESMIRFVVRGPDEERTRSFIVELASRFDMTNIAVSGRRLGPAPAPIVKIRDLFRFHFQLLASDGTALRNHVRDRLTGLKTPDDIQWIVDVDPVDML